MVASYKSFADIWGVLDPKYAKRVQVFDQTLVGDEELTRRWGEIPEGKEARCVEALTLFTDSKNKTPQTWVLNPVIDRQEHEGIYRIVSVDIDTQKQGLKGIIQTLRKGFATEAIWTEARLSDAEQGLSNTSSVIGVDNSQSDATIKFLRIDFPNCSPDAVEAIATSLGSASTVEDPTIRGETYSGTWNTISVSTKIEDDGSGTVQLFLALPQFTINAYDRFGTEKQQDVHYLFDVPKVNAQTIINQWKTANPLGASATISYSRSNGLADIILRKKGEQTLELGPALVGASCRYLESEIAIFGTDDEDLLPCPTPVFGAGISYDRTVRSNGDGTWDIRLITKTVRYRDVDNLVTERNGQRVVTQRQQLGLTDEAKADMSEEAGIRKSQRVDIRDDCSKDVTTNGDAGIAQESVEITKAKSYTETKTNKTVQTTPLAEPTQETGHIKTVRNSDSDYPQKVDTLEVDREILAIEEVVLYDSEDTNRRHGEITESIGIKNLAGKTVTLISATGETLQASVNYDPETDTLNIKKLTVTGKVQTSTEEVAAKGYEQTKTEKTYQTDPLSSPVQETGHVKTVRNEDSEYSGKTNTTEIDRHILPIASVVEYDTDDNDRRHGTVFEDIGIPNVGGSIVTLLASSGETLQASVQYDKESDTLNIKRLVVSGKAQTNTEKIVAKSYEQTRTDKTYQGTPLPDPIQEAGHVKTVRNEDSEYPDKVNTTEIDREIKQVDDVAQYDNADTNEHHSDIVESIGRPNTGVKAIELSALAGQALRATVRYDKESDTLDIVKETREGVELTDDSSIDGNLETSETERKRSVSTREMDTTAAVGELVEVTNKESEYKDKFDTSKTVRTGVPQTNVGKTEGNLEVSESEEKLVTASEVAPPASDGEIVEFLRLASKYKDRFNVKITTRTGQEITNLYDFDNATEDVTVKEILTTLESTAADPPLDGEKIDFQKSPSRYKNRSDIKQVTRKAKEISVSEHIQHYDGAKRSFSREIKRGVHPSTIPVASIKGERVRVTTTDYKDRVNIIHDTMTAEEWYLDFNEPSTSGQNPAFNRKWFWISNSGTIQAKVNDFLAQVTAVTTEQYKITVTVARDENGYYNVNMSANPKESGGGVSDWNNGFDFDIAECKKASAYTASSAKITYTTSQIKAKALLNPSPANDDMISYGAGGVTGVKFLGRGRYKVTVITGVA